MKGILNWLGWYEWWVNYFWDGTEWHVGSRRLHYSQKEADKSCAVGTVIRNQWMRVKP